MAVGNTLKRVRFVKDPRVRIIDDNTVFFIAKDSAVTYYDARSDQLKSIIRDLKTKKWTDAVAEAFEKRNPWLCKIVLDTSRSDFVFLLPTKTEDLAVDLGAGWGQVAIPLSRFCDVVAVEGNADKLEIMKAIADQEKRKNIGFVLGNILDLPFEKSQFDLAILNGVLEWVGSYGGSNDPVELQLDALKKAYDLLVPGGHLYIGIENKYGLKYLLGEIDDHTGLKDFTYLPIEKAKRVYMRETGRDLTVFVHSKDRYESMLRNSGFSSIRFYGAFPDYKFPKVMIDLSSPEAFEYFLEKMDFVDEHKGAEDGSRSFYDGKLRDIYPILLSVGALQHFCPSYAIIARK